MFVATSCTRLDALRTTCARRALARGVRGCAPGALASVAYGRRARRTCHRPVRAGPTAGPLGRRSTAKQQTPRRLTPKAKECNIPLRRLKECNMAAWLLLDLIRRAVKVLRLRLRVRSEQLRGLFAAVSACVRRSLPRPPAQALTGQTGRILTEPQ